MKHLLMKKYYSGMHIAQASERGVGFTADPGRCEQKQVYKTVHYMTKGDIVNVTAVGKKYHFQELLALGYY